MGKLHKSNRRFLSSEGKKRLARACANAQNHSALALRLGVSYNIAIAALAGDPLTFEVAFRIEEALGIEHDPTKIETATIHRVLEVLGARIGARVTARSQGCITQANDGLEALQEFQDALLAGDWRAPREDKAAE